MQLPRDNLEKVEGGLKVHAPLSCTFTIPSLACPVGHGHFVRLRELEMSEFIFHKLPRHRQAPPKTRLSVRLRRSRCADPTLTRARSYERSSGTDSNS